MKDRLFKEEVQGVVFIPEDFSNSLKSGTGTEIKLYLNTQRFLPSNDINKAVSAVVLEHGRQFRIRAFRLRGLNISQAEEIVEPLKDDIHFLFNPSEAYGDFLIPAILVLIIQQTLFIALGESVAKERELGTLNELYSLAGFSTSDSLTGKGMFYLLLYFSYALFFFIVEFAIFKINFLGSYILLFSITLIFIAAMISIAIFIASFFERKILALQVIAFTSYPIFFLTGYVWPLYSMPKGVQLLSAIIPGTPYLDAYVRITQMGAGFYDVLPAVVHLLILLLLGLTAAYFRMKYLFTDTLKDKVPASLKINKSNSMVL